jgi:NAD(P)-dependent dehydrogenase (short-subunit alcohol dehydrogenase family)
MNVSDCESVESVRDALVNDLGGLHVLVNCIGGNTPGATTSESASFFDLDDDEFDRVMDLNFTHGTVRLCRVFGSAMNDNGSIINISSMAADRPLTRVGAYSASKAAVNNFTQWLAVHFAQEGFAHIRVNAIAPGFFLSEQNRYLLRDEKTGGLTDRGETIVAHTPAARFGQPGDLAGAAVWLASDASKFVTGAIIPVDGGFSAFSGV